LLIRDAAYDALPKSVRAELHERFAAWLQTHGDDLVELDEIVGYHLERAATYKGELRMPDPDLSDRASERLVAAARRARWLGDEPTAATLFERALVLTRPHRLDVMVELELAGAYWRSDAGRAAEIATAAADRALADGDVAGEAAARVVAASCRWRYGTATITELDNVSAQALVVLEAAGDHNGLAHAWRGRSTVFANRGQYDQARLATERAAEHVRLAGWPLVPTWASLPSTLTNGAVPADEALAILDEVLPPFPHPRTELHRAVLLGMLGRFDEAQALANNATTRLRDRIGDDGEWALAHIARFQGDHEAAAGYLRRYCDYLKAHHSHSFLATAGPRLARELWALGRAEEGEPFAQLGRSIGDDDDFATQMTWRQAQALIESTRGAYDEAERLAREAVAIGEKTDTLNNLGDAYLDLAEVLRAAGRIGDARLAAEQALERYERKRNVGLAAQARARLAAMEAPHNSPSP
jgi:tetratricopeptide (TPR) repeat protein